MENKNHSYGCATQENEGECNCEGLDTSVNFLQVGKTVACSHCEPDKFAISPIPCKCVCHDPTEDKGWEERWNRQFGYIGDIQRDFIQEEITRASSLAASVATHKKWGS